MRRQNDISQYQQPQRAYTAKHQPSHITRIATDSGMDDNNKKPVLMLAKTTSAIKWLKATRAIISTGIQSQGTWIRRPRWNWSETRNVYCVARKHTTTRIAENARPNNQSSPQLKPCQSEENQGRKDITMLKSKKDPSSKQLSLNLAISTRS